MRQVLRISYTDATSQPEAQALPGRGSSLCVRKEKVGVMQGKPGTTMQGGAGQGVPGTRVYSWALGEDKEYNHSGKCIGSLKLRTT